MRICDDNIFIIPSDDNTMTSDDNMTQSTGSVCDDNISLQQVIDKMTQLSFPVMITQCQVMIT